jgi:hypothetical protein
MKRSLFIIFLISSLLIFAQPNTDVFLFDLSTEKGSFELSNKVNISDNDGYDNQPSFLDDNTILYAGTRKGQTDIAKYSINYGSKIWVNHTDGSEYSPLKIPGQNAVSSIRLEKDGAQKLHKYSLRNGESEVLIEEIIIGYHVWADDNTIVSSVLEDGGLSLYSSSIKDMSHSLIQKNIGRSLHRIPNSDLISFISKEDENRWEIKSYDLKSGKIEGIMGTLSKSEDMCWLPDGSILMGVDNILYKFKPDVDVDWIEVASLEQFGISNITRLTVNNSGNKLAVVGEGGGEEEIDPNKVANGGSMMASFRLIKDGKVLFYEIEIIREVNETLILQLKHFNNDLKGWESKDDTVDFPLKEITATKVVFEGMTFEKIADNEMHVSVDTHNNDGSTSTLKFKYKKD